MFLCTLSAAIVFRVHPFLAKKHPELPFLVIALFLFMSATWQTIFKIVRRMLIVERTGM